MEHFLYNPLDPGYLAVMLMIIALMMGGVLLVRDIFGKRGETMDLGKWTTLALSLLISAVMYYNTANRFDLGISDDDYSKPLPKTPIVFLVFTGCVVVGLLVWFVRSFRTDNRFSWLTTFRRWFVLATACMIAACFTELMLYRLGDNMDAWALTTTILEFTSAVVFVIALIAAMRTWRRIVKTRRNVPMPI